MNGHVIQVYTYMIFLNQLPEYNSTLDAISFDKLKKFVYNVFRLEEEAGFMPNIKSSTDLRNNYNEIWTFCRESREPVFIST